MFFVDFIGGNVISVIVALFTIAFAYFKWTYQYWQRKKLPYFEPSIPYGNITSPFNRKENIAITFKTFYNEMKKKGWKHGGIYLVASPAYFLVNLDYVKNIMTKDFQYFVDRGFYHNEKDDPISAHLFAIGGPKWRFLRTKLTPTFTSGKMKMMFQTLAECELTLQQKMQEEFEKNQPIDVKEILACFTTDIIGSCAFGLDLKSFKQENSPFRMYGRKVFATTKFRAIQRTFAATFPDLARFLKIPNFPNDVREFFINAVKDTVDYREKNNFTRKDFMQLLIGLKNNKIMGEDGKINGRALTIEEVAAQSFVFFLAGFETSSTTMTFALYELAKHQDIQDKVREEINRVLAKYDGKITYESIQDMKYMNQVIDETLRKYPPVPFLTRQCVMDYEIPDESITIEKGTFVIIPVLGIHHDKDIYPDPEKFDPERFTEENKSARHNYAHIPFGEGPRICIGMRFGLMQSKVGLTSLLKKYKFTVSEKTKEPLKFQVNPFILAAEGEIWLNANEIEILTIFFIITL